MDWALNKSRYYTSNVKMLKSLVNNQLTDKDTAHSYLDTYDSLFGRLRTSAIRVVEIGVYDGGSIALWSDFFTNATIYGLDIVPLRKEAVFLTRYPRVVLKQPVDAYSADTISIFSTMKFDVIIDDGPHTLESMLSCVMNYSKMLTDNGILVVEDVPDIRWTEDLRAATPDDLKQYIQVFDLRENKGRWDDILFVINKGVKHIPVV
jgi:hypothetical protein